MEAVTHSNIFIFNDKLGNTIKEDRFAIRRDAPYENNTYWGKSTVFDFQNKFSIINFYIHTPSTWPRADG